AARSANVQPPGSTCTGIGVVCTTPTTAALETTPVPAVEELGCILLTMRSTPITTCPRISQSHGYHDARLSFYVILHGELHSVLLDAYCSLHSSLILTGMDNRIFSRVRDIAPGTPNSTMDRKAGLLASPFLPKMICRV
ncbi:hypothetical protein BO71DRAFT_332952, partial [Aspergillus ellipticus CBS 707.79]